VWAWSGVDGIGWKDFEVKYKLFSAAQGSTSWVCDITSKYKKG